LKSDENHSIADNDEKGSIAVLATSSSVETLREDYVKSSNIQSKQSNPRQVHYSHYTYVIPERVPLPSLVCASISCCKMLGLDPAEISNKKFVSAFSGNILLNGLDRPFSTVYGSHVYGKYNGQLGDGRVIHLGDVFGTNRYGQKQRYEIQLKGAGRTPYGRGFDGRAVLRSSIREYLASEAMYYLNVETTRALTVVRTGMDIRRPWYKEKSNEILKNNTRRGPDNVSYEPGAILCRVSPSFIRFGHIELFAEREEYEELLQIVNFAIYKEYPELQNLESVDEVPNHFINEFHNPTLYINFLRQVVRSSANLIADWMRVGYCQGNMNSDNVLVGGRTIDYGPFGFIEMYTHSLTQSLTHSLTHSLLLTHSLTHSPRYDPSYQPFTADTIERKYSFANQSIAMNVNIKIFGKCIGKLIYHYCNENRIDSSPYLDEIESLVTIEYQKYYASAYDLVKASKLGFKKFDLIDYPLWDELLSLLFKSRADYTIFFRQLTLAADSAHGEEAFLKLQEAFYTEEEGGSTSIDSNAFCKWLDSYIERIKEDDMNPLERKRIQNSNNPKFIPRNWLLMLAYEKAEKNDYTLIEEVYNILSHPYDDDLSDQFCQKTPKWAKNLAGVEFLNCSS